LLKTLKLILAGVISMALAFCGGWFGNIFYTSQKANPTPKPTPAPIINPQPSDNSQNQVVVEITGAGTSEAKTTDKTKKSPKDIIKTIVTDVTKVVTNIIPAVSTTIDKTVPVTGTITAKFIDKKTSADLGSESKPLTGTVAVKGDADNLSVKVDFTSQLTFSVNTPVEKDKLWHVGLYAAAVSDGLGFGAYVQRDFKITTIKNVDLVGFGRMEIDKESKLLFGVEGNF
jgi:hypothetical protein